MKAKRKLGPAIVKKLRKILGPDGFSLEPADLKTYGSDWSGLLKPNPCAIAFPRTTEQVSRLLRLCHEEGLPVVPSGGRTGLSGGAIAAKGELVLSLRRMNRMDPVDPTACTVRVQAGAVTQAVHEHCAPLGLTWPVDFASKGSSQVGGNICTNAGGVRVIRYGTTRNWVLSIELVTLSGEVLELNHDLEKNNTGYDLRHLIIGSEGTLGVVTEATLRLTPVPKRTQVLFFGVQDMNAVIRLFHSARAQAFSLQAFETLSQRCYREVTAFLGGTPPLPADGGSTPGQCGAYVLMEIEADSDSGKLDKWLEEVLRSGLAQDGTLAQSAREAENLWRIREAVAESVMHQSVVYQHDVSVPIRRLAEFSQTLESRYRKDYPEFETFIFGHIGDGNLHVFIRKPAALSQAIFVKKCRESDRFLFEFIREFQGSVSAEHGIGVLKKNALPFCRTPAEREIMGAIKNIFDPKDLLNPGKLIAPHAGVGRKSRLARGPGYKRGG